MVCDNIVGRLISYMMRVIKLFITRKGTVSKINWYDITKDPVR